MDDTLDPELKDDLDEDVDDATILGAGGKKAKVPGEEDESIDAIIISDVFYLLEHKKTCIMEMKRVG